jgi:hypothetical protein
MAPEKNETQGERLVRLEERQKEQDSRLQREVADIHRRVGAVEDDMSALTETVQEINRNVGVLVQARATEIQVDEAVEVARNQLLKEHGLTPEGKKSFRMEFRDWVTLVVAVLGLFVAYQGLQKPATEPQTQGITK